MQLSNHAPRLGGRAFEIDASYGQSIPSGLAAIEEVGLAAVTLDITGKILCCNAAALSLFGPAPLPGRDVRSLMPDLPFRRATPGYNIAYATLWAANSAWRRFSGRDGRGRLFRIEASLNQEEFRLRQQILLGVRPAREPASATLPRRFAGAPLLARLHATGVGMHARSWQAL